MLWVYDDVTYVRKASTSIGCLLIQQLLVGVHNYIDNN